MVAWLVTLKVGLGGLSRKFAGFLSGKLNQSLASRKALRGDDIAGQSSLLQLVTNELTRLCSSYRLPADFPFYAFQSWLNQGGNIELLVRALIARSGGDSDVAQTAVAQLAADYEKVTPGTRTLTHEQVGYLISHVSGRLSATEAGRKALALAIATRNAARLDVLVGPERLRENAPGRTLDVEAIEHAVSTCLQERNFSATGVMGASIIDAEATQRLLLLTRSRFFTGFDVANQARRLATEILEGELTGASNSIKVEILAWCARLLSNVDRQAASTWLIKALEYGDDVALQRAGAFLTAYAGDLAAALGILAQMEGPLARSSAFLIVNSLQGPQAALTWLEQSGVSTSDLDSDGKLIALHVHLGLARWEEALRIAEDLTEDDFVQTPTLFFSAADVHTVQAMPPELRAPALEQFPLYGDDLPLAADDVAMRHRNVALGLLGRAADAALSLGLPEAAEFARDKALWLALRDNERAAEARSTLEQTMRSRSASLRRIALALQFGLKLDPVAVEYEIDRQTALSGGASPDAAIARFAFALSLGDPKSVADYLDRYRTQLTEHLISRGLAFVELEMLALSGQTQRAKALFGELVELGLSSSERERLERVLLEAEGTDPVDQRLAAYESSDSILDLRNLVSALKSRKEWGRLVVYAQTLFNRTRDVSDAEGYVMSLYRTGRLDDIQELFESFPTLLQQSQELRGIRCWTLYSLGKFSLALTALGQLTNTRDHSSYRALGVNIAIASGDWESLQVFVEGEWTARNERAPRDLLRAAQLAQMIGSQRAQELVLEAARKSEGDAAVLLGCYTVACESGSENSGEVSGWLQTAAAASGDDGPVQRMTIQDLVDRQPTWNQHATRVSAMLAKGQVPMFAAAKWVNSSLLSMFLMPALTNPGQSDVRRRVTVYAFSGARGEVMLSPRRVAMDATSLLTSQLLEITQAVFDHFDEIVIPHTTLGWLFAEKRRIKFHQPSRVSCAHEVRRLLADGSLRPFESTTTPPLDLVQQLGEDLAAMFAQALADALDGQDERLVVRPAPLWRVGSFMSEEANLEGYEGRYCSCLDVVEKLVEKAVLTGPEADICRAYLALHERPWEASVHVKDSAFLYLDDVAVSYLQHLKLLPKLHRAGLTAFISTSHLAEVDALIEYESHASSASLVVENLRLQLRAGIEGGKVRVDRRIGEEENAEEDEIRSHPTLAIANLSIATDAIAIDDRFLNQHRALAGSSGDRPVLTAVDVLGILHREKVIADDQYLDKKARLRRAGMCLVPIDQFELDRCLSTAIVNDGNLLESAELRAIRESVLQLRMSDILQLPAEMPWLNRLVQASVGCLRNQWFEGVEVELARAKSEWLLEIMDIRRWAHRFEGASPNAVFWYQEQLSALIRLAALQAPATRRIYCDWLEERVLRPMRDENAPLYASLISQATEWVGLALRQVDRAGGIDEA